MSAQACYPRAIKNDHTVEFVLTLLTLQYGGSVWLPLVTHACEGVSKTEYFLITSFSVLAIGNDDKRKLLSFIMYKV